MKDEENPRALSTGFTVDEALESLGFGKVQRRVFLICGYHWLAVSVQILLLGLIKNGAQCEFDLNTVQATLLTTAVGFGFLIGNFVWGIFADKFGRKPALLVSSLVTLCFGLASAYSTSYYALMLFRALATVGVGGNHVSFSLALELLPKSSRGWASMSMEIFAAVGVCLSYALAAYIMPTHDWKTMIIVGSIPMILVLLLHNQIPESPSWLMAVGRTDEASELLQKMETENKSKLPPGNLAKEEKIESTTEKKSFKVLLSPRLRSLSIKLWIIWFVCVFSYYGAILIQSEMILQEKSGKRCDYREEICSGLSIIHNCESINFCRWENEACSFSAKIAVREAKQTNEACKIKLSKEDYFTSLISSSGEIPGLIIVIFVVNLIGRRAVLFYMFGLSGLAFFSLLPCSSQNFEMLLFFLIRGAAGAYFQTVFLVTTEIFPAEVRSTAMGVSSAIARTGLIITPFVSQFLSSINLKLAILVYGLSCIVASIASIMIPIETTHRPLQTKLSELEFLLEGNENDQEDYESFKEESDVFYLWRLLRIRARYDRTVLKDYDLL